MMEESSLDAIVRHALTEDLCEDFQGGFRALLAGESISFSDVTSDALFSDEVADAQVHAKSGGVLSGSKAFLKVYYGKHRTFPPFTRLFWKTCDNIIKQYQNKHTQKKLTDF